MKSQHRFLPWILLALVLLAISRAPAQTAWQALDALKAQRGAIAVDNVTQIRGQRGQDQPAAWEVATRAADGERVFVIKAGQIVADTIYSSGAGVPVDMRRLRVDSGEAFNIANRAATESKIGFDSIDYELSSASTGNSPLWVMHLRDTEGRDVGEVEISGENGSVLRKSWFHARASTRQPIGPEPSADRRAVRSYAGDNSATPTPAIPSGEQRVGSRVWERTTSGAEDAADRLKVGFQNIGSGFGKIFRGEATYDVRDEERYPRPKTLRNSATR